MMISQGTYNAESEMTSAVGANYLYGGDGRRVAKLNGSGQPTKVYWYGSGGSILAETDNNGNATAEYIFFGGQRIAMLPSGGNAQYYVEDMLGSSRVVTTNTGVLSGVYPERSRRDADFYPFGGERIYTDACDSAYKFTGKERDSESGLDNFGARYDSSSLGRFMTPDPVTMLPQRLRDPQQINLYAYARNNPLRFIDPTGTTIDDSACQRNKKCKKWEEQYRKSKEGQEQWKKLDDNKTLLVTLKWDNKADSSVAGDYKWDSSGRLTGATVTIGGKSADPLRPPSPSSDYPFGSTLSDSRELQVYVFGHELAHVEDVDTPEGRHSEQEIERLYPDAKARFDAEGSSGYAQDKELQATFAIIRADNKRNENVADERAKGIVESYRACQADKECRK